MRNVHFQQLPSELVIYESNAAADQTDWMSLIHIIILQMEECSTSCYVVLHRILIRWLLYQNTMSDCCNGLHHAACFIRLEIHVGVLHQAFAIWFRILVMSYLLVSLYFCQHCKLLYRPFGEAHNAVEIIHSLTLKVSQDFVVLCMFSHGFWITTVYCSSGSR